MIQLKAAFLVGKWRPIRWSVPKKIFTLSALPLREDPGITQ